MNLHSLIYSTYDLSANTNRTKLIEDAIDLS